MLSGIVFEGNANGTCPLSYQLRTRSDLYGLKLSPKKIERYFFYPDIIKKGLIPLLAKGEFSHPRLKVLEQGENDTISGAQARFEQIKILGTIQPNDQSKIQNESQYLAKMKKIFNRNLVLFSDIRTP